MRDKKATRQNGNSKSFPIIINLNVNGLNSPIKIHRLAEWIKTYDPTMSCLQETQLKYKDANYTESESTEKYIPCK